MSRTINLPPVQYTSNTSESILQEMVSSIPALTEKWTDLNPSDVGVTILELLSWSMDRLLYYLDRRTNEAFLITARERRSVMDLCKLIGYRLNGVVSSTTVLEFVVEESSGKRIIIPAYTRCAASGTGLLRFATTERVTIPAGASSAIVGARQGTPKTETFASNGQSSQRYTLSETMVDSSSMRVIIDGVVWQEVDSFVNSQAGDNHFIVEIDHEDTISILLGDGFFGKSPPFVQVNNIEITYLISDGGSGNTGSGNITSILDDIYDVDGDEVSLSVSNIQAATGGSDRETIEHAKVQGPAELSALFRAMTKSDYITLCEGFSGVAKANSWGEMESDPPDYNLFNWVMLVVAPAGVTQSSLISDTDNGLPSEQLKSDLFDYLKERSCITTRVKIINPDYVPIVLSARVYYAKGFLPANVRSGVEEAVTDFFGFDSVSFGKEIRKSNVIRIIDEVSGVDYVELSLLHSERIINFDHYSIIGHGGSSQQGNPTVTVEDNGKTVHIVGNGWQKIAFEYDVTANTVLEFDFKSPVEGEIQGIGFAKSNTLQPGRFFQLYGTQPWGSQIYNDYSGSDWKTYSINVGNLFTGEDVPYLVFGNDHDASPQNGEVYFSNIRIYESDELIKDTITLQLYELPFLRTLTLTVSEAVEEPEPADVYPCPPA